MKRILRSFLTLLMLVVWASGFAQDTETIDLTQQGFKNGDVVSVVNGSDVTLTFVKGEKAQYTPTYYTNKSGNSVRLYAECTLKITSSTKTIKKITFTTVKNKGNELKSTYFSAGNYTQNTWKGETKNLSISPANVIWLQKLEITYATTTKPLKSLVISGDATKKAYNEGEEFDPTGLVVTGTYDDASTAAITDGITWTKTPAKLAVGTTSCSVTATVNGVTSTAYEVTGLTVTKNTAIVYDFTANPNVWGIVPEKNNNKTGHNVVAGKELKVSGVVMTATNGGKYGTCLYEGTTSATLNVYSGGSITFKAPEGFNISQIVFKGSTLTNLNASDETYTNGSWTGNVHEVTFSNKSSKVEIKSATIKLVATSLDLSEAETAEETAKKLTESNGKTIDVKLARTLTANVWNTICLPFDVTAEQIANVLKSEGNVKEYGSEDVNKQTIYFKDATIMTAGTPYLIKPTEDAKELVFKGVTIKNVDAVDRMVGDKYNMCGVFGKYAMNTNGTELFLKTDGKFYVPAEGKETMKGFRAYFLVPTNTAGAALNLSFGDATGINGVAADAEKSVKVYNVNGQYVGTSLEALPKGLYIVGGKKVLK